MQRLLKHARLRLCFCRSTEPPLSTAHKERAPEVVADSFVLHVRGRQWDGADIFHDSLGVKVAPQKLGVRGVSVALSLCIVKSSNFLNVCFGGRGSHLPRSWVLYSVTDDT